MDDDDDDDDDDDKDVDDAVIDATAICCLAFGHHIAYSAFFALPTDGTFLYDHRQLVSGHIRHTSSSLLPPHAYTNVAFFPLRSATKTPTTLPHDGVVGVICY